MAPYEKLNAWQESHQLVLQIYHATESWPKREIYGLTSQARRAASSVATNIAEGSAKRRGPEFRRFLEIALGSTSELCYLLLLARDLEYLPAPDWETLEKQRDRAGRLLWGLYDNARKRVGG